MAARGELGVEVLKITDVVQENSVIIRDGVISGLRTAAESGIALGMGTTTAYAGLAQMSFGQADTNSDGAITREEAASFSALEQRFDAADTNNNGLIERQEYIQVEAGYKPVFEASKELRNKINEAAGFTVT